MKKLLSLTLTLIIVMSLMTNVYAVSNCKVSLTAKSEVNKGDEFSVDVMLSNIEDENGIIAISGKLEYDTNSLELKKMERQGEWAKPTYNELNGEFVTERGDYATNNEAVFKITFKVKEESKQNLEIAIRNITASNGVKDIESADATTRVTVMSIIPDEKPDTNPNTPNDTTQTPELVMGEDNNSNKNNNKVASEKDLPDTGLSNTMVPVIIAMISIIAVLSFIKMRKIDKEIKG